MQKIVSLITIVILFVFESCQSKKKDTLFQLLSFENTGIDFENTIKNTEEFNIFNYRNFYNGGGVGIGDINNDGLQDIIFTANMGSNKLYLNKGIGPEKNFKFEDITTKAGVAQLGKWNTGVVLVDINNDGWLDIYICNAGIDKWKNGEGNALFINNHDLTFTEKAAEYGLADKGYSTHAAFLDYDLDGDLDCYILNNSFIPVNTLNYDNNRDLRAEYWPVKDFLKGGGDKFMRNDNGKFVDISAEAGVYGSLIGFGLGVTVGDINNDNYPDIYISNDFFERDYLYINQKNGKFTEELEARISHTSLASMGADMGDINNDGNQEIFVTDMLPLSEKRLKTTTSFDNNYTYKLKYEKGFYNQYQQNSLQLNNAEGNFKEIANYANVAASDWSWGALLFDADNDAKTDIYVSNGIYNDVIDQDFIDFFANDLNQRMVLSGQKEKFDNILNQMPSNPIANNFFHNEGNLKFAEKGKDFGFEELSFSNGAAYADLDNDGDLDLVVNNVNQKAFIYKNNSEILKNNYIQFSLKGSDKNEKAIGSKILLYADNQIFTKQINPSKGFQSSTEYTQTIGLGKLTKVDSVLIFWPNNTFNKVENFKINSLNKIDIFNIKPTPIKKSNSKIEPFLNLDNTQKLDSHIENDYDDFFNEKNIPLMLSTEGPKAAIADVNGDGFEDVYICGATNQAGQLYIQKGNKLVKQPQKLFETMAFFEDTAAEFLDVDGDGDQDLYVGSGGNEHEPAEKLTIDRLYLNDGKGNYTFAQGAIPNNTMNTSCILPHDFDADGDIDIFVGNRSVPKVYGQKPNQFLLINNGKGQFKNEIKTLAPDLENAGMVRAATWVDLDKDKIKELVVLGDWIAPQVYKIQAKILQKTTTGLENLSGFWGAIKAADIDNDGDNDLIMGNIGENFALKASQENTLKLFVADFDNNQTVDKLISKNVNNSDVPVFLKKEMMEQFPYLKSKNLKHSDYASHNIYDLFDKTILNNAQVGKVNYLKSIIAINDGKGHFSYSELPIEAQLSCVNTIEILDYNNDSKPDLFLGGNFTKYLPQFTRLDACSGIILKNLGKNKYENIKPTYSGFVTEGEVKDLKKIKLGKTNYLLSVANNKSPQLFKLNTK